MRDRKTDSVGAFLFFRDFLSMFFPSFHSLIYRVRAMRRVCVGVCLVAAKENVLKIC